MGKRKKEKRYRKFMREMEQIRLARLRSAAAHLTGMIIALHAVAAKREQPVKAKPDGAEAAP